MLGLFKNLRKPKPKELLTERAAGGLTGVRKAWGEGGCGRDDPGRSGRPSPPL